MTTTARDIMTPAPKCVGENETLVDAAGLMATWSGGPADLRRRQPAEGHAHRPRHRGEVPRPGRGPPPTRAGELAEGKPVTIGADDDIDEALKMMKEHQVRRLPVIDDHSLVGIISQADIAMSMSSRATGEVVEEISE